MKSNQTCEVSIVLPCYNPGPGWADVLKRNVRELRRKLPDTTIQIIVSNDGSTRLTAHQVQLAESVSGLVFLDNIYNEGKGSAIRKGCLRAEGELIIYTDIDFPFGTDPIVEMVRQFRADPDCGFIYGNRNCAYFSRLPLKRKLISYGLHIVNRIVLRGGIVDTQAGIKGFRRALLPVLQSTKTNTFVFEIELIQKLLKLKTKIGKVEVCAKPSIVFSDFGVKVLYREAVSFARILVMGSLWNDLS